ncbi:MAG: glycosyltransferase family 2 protein [Mangrovibacterium sp.]
MIFSIVIPTYNHADTLRKSIESALNQKFDQEYEIFIANNNSSDHTEDVLNLFKNSIRVIRNAQTVSLIENHNVCLREAKGDYIIFCHSDDLLLPDALASYYQKLKLRNFPDKYVLWGKSVFRDFQQNWEKSGLGLEQISKGKHIFQAFMTGGLTPSGTCFSRRSFLDAGGYIVTDTVIAPSDMVSMWRLILNDFQFEMSGRQFFIREYASTATERSRKEWTEAKKIAVKNFLDASKPHEIETFKKYITEIEDLDTTTLLALRSNKLVDFFTTVRHFSKKLLKKERYFFS